MTPHNNETSQARLLANQANARHSTGPKTEPGKAKSKMNALRHGLTGQFCVMNEPDRIAWAAFEKDYLEALAPVGAIERQLAITLAQNNWRLNRARAIESNIEGLGNQEFAEGVESESPEVEFAVTQAKTWLNHHPAFTNLTLYENRIQRQLAQVEKRLELLQSERKAAEVKALDEAELLLRQSLMKGEDVNPASSLEVSGFVFSAAKVLASLNRKLALASARFHKQNGWDPKKTFPEAQPLSFLRPDTLPKAA
ncbi:MAG: hypothetical protein EBY17_12075 [Acidobacteriia bacterium]|nr:hypothetical protein [Terriglobia bacterium]